MQDYDEKYPLVAVSDTHISAKNPYGWVDALEPYLKSYQVFQCPNHPLFNNHSEPVQVQARGLTTYYFNSRLAGVWQGKVNNVAGTIMTAHGNDGIDYSNARYSKRSLPAHWRGNENSPAHHHLGGTNYAFADGHVKWLKPGDVSNIWNGRSTFANP